MIIEMLNQTAKGMSIGHINFNGKLSTYLERVSIESQQ